MSYAIKCRSEYTYPQEPTALVCDAGEYPITRIVARWRTPAGPVFRVVCALGQYIIAYDEGAGIWTVTAVAPEGCACN